MQRPGAHIRTKVRTEGKATRTGHQGGHSAQFYLDERFTARFAALDPYPRNAVPRVTLDTDILYGRTGSTGGLLSLRYDARHISRGVNAGLTVSVDPCPTIFLPAASRSPAVRAGLIVVRAGLIAVRAGLIRAVRGPHAHGWSSLFGRS